MIVGSFGELEAEYASIRQGAGLVDCPHRATLRINGADRIDLLNRLLTQRFEDIQPGMARPSFWLNRQGRLLDDVLVAQFDDCLMIDTGVHQARTTIDSLMEYVFAEDVAIDDVSAETYRIALHGRRAADVLSAATGSDAHQLDNSACTVCDLAGATVRVIRFDQAGEPGLHVCVPRVHVEEVWSTLVAVDEVMFDGKGRVRPCGWYAFNIARIEAGTPMFNIDFGGTNLPAETGLVDSRISFNKGCYIGQEVVARMHNLGEPKQKLVGLSMIEDVLPVAGSQVFAEENGGLGPQIGVITSSTLSPMLGSQPVAFAMLKKSSNEVGTRVLTSAEGTNSMAVVTPLQFYPAPHETVGQESAT